MTAGQQRQLHDAIQTAGSRLDESTAAQATAAASPADTAAAVARQRHSAPAPAGHSRSPVLGKDLTSVPAPERTIAWTATQNGHRIRLRYIGTARNSAWLHNRCAGLNLRTLVNAGLARSGGTWVLT